MAAIRRPTNQPRLQPAALGLNVAFIWRALLQSSLARAVIAVFFCVFMCLLPSWFQGCQHFLAAWGEFNINDIADGFN